MKEKPDNLTNAYNELIEMRQIQDDAEQRRILADFLNLSDEIANIKKPTILSRVFGNDSANSIKGIYIYGSVGTGKSMLMDLFFKHLPDIPKHRDHFHSFMLGIHAKLNELRKGKGEYKDLIKQVASDFARNAKILCLDELQITDIADAMVVGRLFEALFQEGVILVTTSNRPPDDLYKDGLQRERFTPFLDLIKQQLCVTRLDNGRDYRLEHMKHISTVYFSPLGPEADTFLQKSFAELSNNATPTSYTLDVNGRALTLERTHGDIALCSFSELCEQPLGAADYLEIARTFSVVMLSDIPCLTHEQRNEARRFVTFIDELYEHSVMFLCTAAVPVAELYTSGDGSFEFERTASRLIEMQSEQYIHKEHKV